METLLRLEQEVRAGRGEVAAARKEVTQLEVTLKQQQIRLEGQSAKHVVSAQSLPILSSGRSKPGSLIG